MFLILQPNQIIVICRSFIYQFLLLLRQDLLIDADKLASLNLVDWLLAAEVRDDLHSIILLLLLKFDAWATIASTSYRTS